MSGGRREGGAYDRVATKRVTKGFKRVQECSRGFKRVRQECKRVQPKGSKKGLKMFKGVWELCVGCRGFRHLGRLSSRVLKRFYKGLRGFKCFGGLRKYKLFKRLGDSQGFALKRVLRDSQNP